MIRWLFTGLAVHGTDAGREGRRAALMSADDSCPVCDHPFGNLTHACISATGTATPSGTVGPELSEVA